MWLMDEFERMWGSAAGLTGLVSWSHRKAMRDRNRATGDVTRGLHQELPRELPTLPTLSKCFYFRPRRAVLKGPHTLTIKMPLP